MWCLRAEEVRSLTGDPFQRYSAYRDRWWDSSGVLPRRLCYLCRPFHARGTRYPTCPGRSRKILAIRRCRCGSSQVNRRRGQIAVVLKGPSIATSVGRNLPAQDGTSKLSPHVRFGTISARTMVHAALHTLSKGGQVSAPMSSPGSTRLVWREFFSRC